MATWLEKSRSPEYSPAKLSQMLAEVEAVIGMDELDEAMAHETIIVGGYLNTHLIKAKSIKADHIGVGEIKAEHIAADVIESFSIKAGSIKSEHIAANAVTSDKISVESLSSISANIGSITSGTITGATVRTSSGTSRIELSSNLLRSYRDGVRRVQLDYDSLDFYTADNRLGGEVVASVDSLFNLPMISVQSSNGMAFLQSRKTSTNYAQVYASAYQGVEDEALAGMDVRRGNNEGSIEVGPGGAFISGRHGSSVTTLEVSGSGGATVYGKFSVTGQKSAVVKTEDYGWRKLYALETPDNRFVTYVEKELAIGEHYIEIEPMFRQTISDYFVVPHIQNMAEVSILERDEKGFRVLVGEKKAEVVFEINGIRKGYEGVYMEEAECGFEQYRLSELKRGVINETSDSGHEQGNSDTETSDGGALTDKRNSPGED